MGYTHYWGTGFDGFTTKEWKELKKRAKIVIGANKDLLCFEFNEPKKKPVVNDECIRFNGKDDDGHETFWLSKKPTGFQFCKTAHKPYDVAVIAILQLASEITYERFVWSSDGAPEVYGEAREYLEALSL